MKGKLPQTRKASAKWRAAALKNYQRARSGPITITQADGSSETVGAWEMEQRRRANLKTKRRRAK